MSILYSSIDEDYETLPCAKFVSHDDIRMIVDTAPYLVQKSWRMNSHKN